MLFDRDSNKLGDLLQAAITDNVLNFPSPGTCTEISGNPDKETGVYKVL
jgi:hypothetical protein